MDKTTRVEVNKADIEGLSIGDNVTIRLKGKVMELEAPRSTKFGDEKARKHPPQITIEQDSVDVEKMGGGSIAELVEEF